MERLVKASACLLLALGEICCADAQGTHSGRGSDTADDEESAASSESKTPSGSTADGSAKTDSPNGAGSETSGAASGSGTAEGGVVVAPPANTAYTACPPKGTACKVMPLGDSVTDGKPAENGGYRVELFAKAVAAGQFLQFVGSLQNGPATVAGKPFPPMHDGHPGYTIEPSPNRGGLTTIAAGLLKTYQPHVVLLLIGGNDVVIDNDLANAGTRYGKLLDLITTTSPDALVVVGAVTPENVATANVKVVKLNAQIKSVVSAASKAGKHVTMVDLYTPLDKTNSSGTYTLLADKLHPTDAGYKIMGDVWYTGIQAHLH